VKAVKLLGNCKAEMVDRSMPEVPCGYALIKVAMCGICSTDIGLYFKDNKPLEHTPGHEIVGTIAEINGETGLKTGQRVLLNLHVTCEKCKYCKEGLRIFCSELKCLGTDLDGGAAEYLAMPFGNLTIIPDDISFEEAILITDVFGTPFNAVKKAKIGKCEKIAVIGAGSVGVLCCLCASYFGGDVMVMDLDKSRQKLALEFGAKQAVSPFNDDFDKYVSDFTDGEGFDTIFDCSGSNAGFLLGLKLVRIRGRQIQLGVVPNASLNLYEDLIMKEITLIGSRGYVDDQVDEMIDLIRDTPRIGELVTHKFPLEKAQEAFDTANSLAGFKVALVP